MNPSCSVLKMLNYFNNRVEMFSDTGEFLSQILEHPVHGEGREKTAFINSMCLFEFCVLSLSYATLQGHIRGRLITF